MSDDAARVAVAEIKGQLVGVEHTIKVAHKRIDKMEILLREDFKDIKASLENLTSKLGELDGFMNRGKGWAAAGLLLAGTVGGIVAKVAAVLFK